MKNSGTAILSNGYMQSVKGPRILVWSIMIAMLMPSFAISAASQRNLAFSGTVFTAAASLALLSSFTHLNPHIDPQDFKEGMYRHAHFLRSLLRNDMNG